MAWKQAEGDIILAMKNLLSFIPPTPGDMWVKGYVVFCARVLYKSGGRGTQRADGMKKADGEPIIVFLIYERNLEEIKHFARHLGDAFNGKMITSPPQIFREHSDAAIFDS